MKGSLIIRSRCPSPRHEPTGVLRPARHLPVAIEGVLDRGDHDAALIAAGGLLPGPDAVPAGPTFGEWLESRARPSAAPAEPSGYTSSPLAGTAPVAWKSASPHGGC